MIHLHNIKQAWDIDHSKQAICIQLFITYSRKAAAHITQLRIDAPKCGTLEDQGLQCFLCLRYHRVHLQENKELTLMKTNTKLHKSLQVTHLSLSHTLNPQLLEYDKAIVTQIITFITK